MRITVNVSLELGRVQLSAGWACPQSWRELPHHLRPHVDAGWFPHHGALVLTWLGGGIRGQWRRV